MAAPTFKVTRLKSLESCLPCFSASAWAELVHSPPGLWSPAPALTSPRLSLQQPPEGACEHQGQGLSSAHNPPGLLPPLQSPQGPASPALASLSLSLCPPLLPLSPSFILLQPHGPPHCFSIIPDTILPQDLCTGCSFCLEGSSQPSMPASYSHSPFRFQLKCYRLTPPPPCL